MSEPPAPRASGRPLFAKTVLGALVILASMAFMAWLGESALTRVVTQTRQIVENNLDASVRIAGIATRVQSINARLHRLMTLRAAAVEEGNVANELAEIAREVDQVISDLAAYRDAYANRKQADAINDALVQLRNYKVAVEWVGSMLEIDFASTVAFIRPFDDLFTKLTGLLATMTATTVEEARALSADATADAARTGKIFVFLAAGAGLGLATFAWAAGRHQQKLLFNTVYLEAEVAARTRDLMQSTEDLRIAKEEAEKALDQARRAQRQLVEAEKMASLGELVAGVAHEINTPVGTTLTAASLLSERTREINQFFAASQMRKSDLERYLQVALDSTEIMVTNIHRAAELIQSFKQVAADRTSAERRTFALGQYLDEVLISLKPRIRKSGVQVAVHCPEQIDMDSYPGALSQVVTNLLVNALVHAFDDERPGRITLSVLELDGAHVEMRFRDDGRGIPPDVLPRIFDPFFTTRRGSGGTGLGLNIVFNLVVQTLGGTIRAESRAGEGTTFILALPLSAPAATPQRAEAVP